MVRPGTSQQVTQRLIEGISHVGITVRNRDTSLGFYRDPVEVQVIESSGEEDVARVFDIPGARIKGAELASGDSTIVELLEHVAMPGEIAWEGATVAHRCDPDGAHFELVQRGKPIAGQ